MRKEYYEEKFIENISKNISQKDNFEQIKNNINIKKYCDKLYQNNKNLILKICVICFIIVLLIPIVIKIGDNRDFEKYSVEEKRNLARAIYNSTMVYEEDKKLQEIKEDNFVNKNDKFKYEKIKVVKSFKFDIISNCSFKPFFKTDLTGEKIEIVIAELEFKMYSTSNLYRSDMIIIVYQDEIMGFLAPYLSCTNCFSNQNYEKLTNYYFQSCSFITDNQIVKYYDKNDMIYIIEVDIFDIGNIKFDVTYGLPFEKETKLDTINALDNSYDELNCNYVIELIDQVKVEKNHVSAIIEKIENGKIYVYSSHNTTIKTISLFNNCVICINGEEISDYNNVSIKLGDEIEFYYYNRYKGYEPVDIYVDYINILDK